MTDTTPSKRVAKRAVPQPKPVEPTSTTNGDEDDDDDEETTTAKPAMKSPLRRGSFSEASRIYNSTSSFAQSFRPEEKNVAIKFMEDEPYAAFRRHWIEGTNNDGQRTVKAYTCPISFDEDCPLCDIGDRPQAVSAFNVAVINEQDGSVELKSWDVGVRLFNVLKSYASDPKIAPLTRGYFLVSKTGKKQSTQYNIIPVKASALTEDYDIPVPSKEDLERLKLYDVNIVEITPQKKLREVAAEQSDYE